MVTERARTLTVHEVNATRTLIRRKPNATDGARQTWVLRDRGRISWIGDAYRLRFRACAETQCREVTRRFTSADQGPPPTATPAFLSVVPAYDAAARRLMVDVAGTNADNAYVSLQNYTNARGEAINPFRLVAGVVQGDQLRARFVADGISAGQFYALGAALANSRDGKTTVLPSSNVSPAGSCLTAPLNTLLPGLPCLALPTLPALPVPPLPALPLPPLPVSVPAT